MKKALWVWLVCNTFAFLASALLSMNGSLETFPSEDEIEAARLVWGLAAGLFLCLEVLLVWLLRRARGV